MLYVSHSCYFNPLALRAYHTVTMIVRTILLLFTVPNERSDYLISFKVSGMTAN